MTEPGSSKAPFRILHAEDSPDDAFLIGRAFQKAAPEAKMMLLPNGEAARNYLGAVGPYADREKSPLPDLVLLDLKLPRMSGLEVLEWMKSRPELEKIPVCILSSSSQREDVEKASRLGAEGYFSKSGNFGELTEIARKIAGLASRACLSSS